MADIVLKINGCKRNVEEPVSSDTPLAYVLRNVFDLTSVRIGCEKEQCGACKVIVDGKAVPSCMEPVSAFRDKEIVTLEGLSEGDKMSDLQQAFLHNNAGQCGYCLSGIIMSAKALLDCEPSPTDEAIRQALDNNLCRCGAHPRILRAIKKVAERGAA